MKLKIYFWILLFVGSFGFSQTLSSSLDKKTTALGEPNVFKIRIDNLAGKDVVAAPKNQLLPFHFEAIKDSIAKSPQTYERVVQFAVFQEGTFKIPALDIKIGGQLYHTVPYEVEVVNTAKKGDQINDIMKNKEVKLSAKDYWGLYKWWFLGFLVLLATIFAVWQLLKYGRKKKSSPQVMSSKALRDLEALKNKKYIESGNYRSFYVELIDISRNFLTQQYNIPADVLLTDDLADFMKQNHTISAENERVVEEVFHRGDLVKFAKIIPDGVVMQRDFDEIQALIRRSAQDIEFENLRKDV